jgi:cyclopropane fatty-acyl-phospholipid synthase-like methyltransferase
MVNHLYNSLAKFEGWFRSKPYPVHKKLNFSVESKFQNLDEWLQQNVHLNSNLKILDAGCGNGYSLLNLVQKNACDGLGISLSEVEVKRANKFANDYSIEKLCAFKCHNFENDLHQQFDFIYAIESVKHASNLAAVMANFAKNLSENGTLILVDDFAVNEIKNKEHLSLHKKYWHCDVLLEKDVLHLALQNNLTLIDTVDFTTNVIKRTREDIEQKIKRLNFIKKFLPFSSYKVVVDSFIGGYLLDYFYTENEMRYKAFVFKKKGE